MPWATKSPISTSGEPERREQDRADDAEAGEPARGNDGALPHGRDRRHARGPERGPQAREHGHEDPDEQRDDDRPRLEREAVVRAG